jgi:hypothetical protein
MAELWVISVGHGKMSASVSGEQGMTAEIGIGIWLITNIVTAVS